MKDGEIHTLREAFATTSPDDRATESCPPPERIWEAVLDELDPRMTREILEHLASCPVCTEAWRLAAHLEQGDQLALAPGRERAGRARWLGLGGAVAALFAYLVVGVATQDLPAVGSIARSEEAPGLELVGPRALSRAECRPAWTAIDGALYDVQVSDQGLQLIASGSGLDNPSFHIREAALPTPARLLINVQAYREQDGAPIAERTLEFECTG